MQDQSQPQQQPPKVPKPPQPKKPGEPELPTYNPFHVPGGTFMPQGSKQQIKAAGREEDLMRQGGFI